MSATATVERVALDDRDAKELRTAGKKASDWLARRNELIWQAHQRGASLREIGQAVGLSHPGVLRVIRAREQFETLRDAGIVEVILTRPKDDHGLES